MNHRPWIADYLILYHGYCILHHVLFLSIDCRPWSIDYFPLHPASSIQHLLFFRISSLGFRIFTCILLPDTCPLKIP